MGPEFLTRGPNISLGSTLGLVPTTNMKMNSLRSVLRSRHLEVVGERKNGRARGRHASPLACLPLARPFFFAPTTSKRLLRRLENEVNLRVGESKDFWDSLRSKRFRAVSEQRARNESQIPREK